MRIRLLAIVVLVLILSLGSPGAPAVIRGRSFLSLIDCSPPAGLQLPVGQGIAVGCRVEGEASVIHVDFLVNQVVQHAADVRPGEIASWTWVPAQVGRCTLAVVAREQGGTDREYYGREYYGREYYGRAYSAWSVATFSRQVLVLAGDSPVRIP